MVVSEQLRKAIEATGLTNYRLAKDSGVSIPVLDRFMARTSNVRSDTIDRLCVALGLELTAKKPRTVKKTRP